MRTGIRLGDYEVLMPLGSGGAGSVYRVRHVESGREYGLKTLSVGNEFNEEIQNRYVREVSIAQRLSSPYLMSYTDSGYDEATGQLYYVMEFVPWGTLHDVLQRRGRLPWRDAVECGIQLCRGLAVLHGERIVHRDLKPANIFLSDEGHLKIGDFGLARDLQSERLTLEGKTVGTLQYFAPEQAMGRTDLDGRADLYALGCLLFEMVSGRTPFASAKSQDLFECHVKLPPPKLREVFEDCPEELSQLVDWLLAKRPADRPQSADETEQILTKILESSAEDTPSSPRVAAPITVGRAVVDSTLTKRLIEDAGSPAKEISTGKWLLIAGILIVLVAAAVMLQR
jgi:serine/threonine protein kinase